METQVGFKQAPNFDIKVTTMRIALIIMKLSLNLSKVKSVLIAHVVTKSGRKKHIRNEAVELADNSRS